MQICSFKIGKYLAFIQLCLGSSPCRVPANFCFQRNHTIVVLSGKKSFLSEQERIQTNSTISSDVEVKNLSRFEVKNIFLKTGVDTKGCVNAFHYYR